jgi:hypothetical protein
LRITPTIAAAVIAFNGAVNESSPRVVSIRGAPIKIKIEVGKKVKNGTITAPIKAEASGVSGPLATPRNVTTMMSARRSFCPVRSRKSSALA